MDELVGVEQIYEVTLRVKCGVSAAKVSATEYDNVHSLMTHHSMHADMVRQHNLLAALLSDAGALQCFLADEALFAIDNCQLLTDYAKRDVGEVLEEIATTAVGHDDAAFFADAINQGTFLDHAEHVFAHVRAEVVGCQITPDFVVGHRTESDNDGG